MFRVSRTTVLCGLALAIASPAEACSPVFKRWWANKSARPAKDCSFEGGGRHDWTSGEAAIDLGNGRVMQIIHDVHSPETALVIDCEKNEGIGVYNPVGEETSCGLWSDIKEHLTPTGKLDLSVGENLDHLSEYVVAKGFKADGGGWQLNNAMLEVSRRDTPDWTCGCRLFYPDSEGAAS